MSRTDVVDNQRARTFWSGPLKHFAAAEDLSRFYQRRAERVATLLDCPAQRRVLDIGCGAGFLSERLARGGHDVVALDLSSEQLGRTRQRCEGLSVDPRCGGTETLKADERFDAICAIGVLPYMRDPIGYAGELAARLAPGGTLVLSLTRASTPYVLSELFRHVLRFRPRAQWWTIAGNLIRTGIWSGGFIDRKDWRRCRPIMLDAALRELDLRRVAGFGLFNIDALDRREDQSRIVSALAFRGGWSIVLAYQKR